MTTQADSIQRLEAVIVARRWDQLGGRLSAIINARSLAELLDLEFRFVWPRGRDAAVNDPRQIFSQSFLDAFETQPSELDACTTLPQHEVMALEAADRRRTLAAVGPGTLVEVNEIFDVLSAASEGSELALERLVARDTSWYLDVFGDELLLSEKLELARWAVELDSGFAGAQARLARVADVSGDWKSARVAAARSLRGPSRRTDMKIR